MTTEVEVLQALRLKGRPLSADVAAAIESPEPAVEEALVALVHSGCVEEGRGRFKITKDGRAVLEELLSRERAVVDQDAVRVVYTEFGSINSVFKSLMADWQLRDGEPNDHADPEYDAKIVTRLTELHADFRPLLEEAVRIAPRLHAYPGRFAAALTKVCDGDHSWLARPLVDSYHTIWFEFHEDLIGIAGLKRADEAAAGRAE